MLIVQIEPPHATRGGDWYYRTLSPGLAMSRHPGVTVVDLTNVHRARDRLIRDAEIVVLNMVCDPDLLPLVVERKALGRPTVYEINDDVASLQPWNPAASFFQNPEHQLLFRRHAHLADAIQFCTPELARLYGFLNPRSIVFRNQIATVPERSRARTDRIVLGWGGSHGHLQDMTRIAPRLVAWIAAQSSVKFHLMASDPMARLFDELPSEKFLRFEPGSLDAYYAFLDTLDVGLAPLENSGFNRCRSDVKFLEYASRGVVPVVQLLAPYVDTVEQGKTGFLFDTVDEMIGILDHLLARPASLDEVGQAARAYVLAERREDRHSVKRLQFYRELLKGQETRAPDAERLTLHRFVRELEGAEVDGNHLSLESTRFESLLYDALVMGQMQRRPTDAAALLRQASEFCPDSYRPHLFAASFVPDPVNELQWAIRKNPKSVKAWLEMGEIFDRAGNWQGALKMFLAAAEVCPGYEVPYLRTAAILKEHGQTEQAGHFARLAEDLVRPLEMPA